MRKTVTRSIRQSFKRLSDVAITVDNITKTLAIGGAGQWELPFEWVLDHDGTAFDANNQRACVVSPLLTKTMTAVETTVVERGDGQLEVKVDWDGAKAEEHVPSGSIPCTTPRSSSFTFNTKSVAQTVTMDTVASTATPKGMDLVGGLATTWTGRELYTATDRPNAPPSCAVVKNFFTSPDQAKHEVVRKVEQYGFAVAEDDQLCTVAGSSTPAVVQKRCAAAERLIKTVFPVLRNSHYGAMSTWSDSDNWKTVPIDSTTDPEETAFCESKPHMDGAYLSSHLDLHTDGTYFKESPKLQSYGCIFTSASTVGGETTLSDGFAAVRQLFSLYPEAAALLSSVEVGGQYRKEGLWYEAHRPVITICPRTKHVTQVSFNNADRMPMSACLSPEVLRQFYAAYHKFHNIVHVSSVTFQLRPGQMLFFDNHRALHGRKQFSGPRVMCGAYVGLDEYYSSLLMAESDAKKLK